MAPSLDDQMGSSAGLGAELVAFAGGMGGVPQIMVELEHTRLMQLPSTSPSLSERGRDAHVCTGARASIISFFHSFIRVGTGTCMVSYLLKAPLSILCYLREGPLAGSACSCPQPLG